MISDATSIVHDAAAEVADTLPSLVRVLREAYREAHTPEEKLVARILRDRLSATFRSVIQLIEKIEQRPILLGRARRVLAVADETWICKELIRELGAMRIQDREFDAELDAIYREARTRLAVLESGDLEQQEGVL